jgi:hypothetical protein
MGMTMINKIAIIIGMIILSQLVFLRRVNLQPRQLIELERCLPVQGGLVTKLGRVTCGVKRMEMNAVQVRCD